MSQDETNDKEYIVARRIHVEEFTCIKAETGSGAIKKARKMSDTEFIVKIFGKGEWRARRYKREPNHSRLKKEIENQLIEESITASKKGANNAL